MQDHFDVVIIGAGVTGLYTLHQLRQRGLSVRVIDDAPAVGGTWYWCRYPGCRFDSESPTYSYSFSDELLREWDWTEQYSPQARTERYLNLVADRYDLRRDIELSRRVVSTVWDAADHRWLVRTDDGRERTGRFLITAVGALSACYVPPFEGLDSFTGQWCHTGRWPQQGLNVAGKRVGIVGAGATAVQIVPVIAPKVAQLTIFQRTPNYCVPLRNGPISDEQMARIKASYPDIFRICSETPHGFLHQADARSALSLSREERLAFFEKTWLLPGFAKFLANFQDVMLPGPANDEYSEFVRAKIRARVHDPEVAEKLIPRDHPFGSKRVPCESGYYDVFNRDNVMLVDVKSSPIERITPTGLRTAQAEYPLDVIIFATGYDAVTGALNQIDVRGENGISLKEKFRNGPRTFMGLQSRGFPNLFTVNVAGARNTVRVMEPLVDWIVDCIAHLRTQGFNQISPTQESENAWTAHVIAATDGMLRSKTNSWYVGGNIPGKARFLLTTPDPAPTGRAQRAAIAASGYKGFELS